MSTFDYAGSKELAMRLVEKFGTTCKIETATKIKNANVVFVDNTKGSGVDSATATKSKQVYVTGVDLDVAANDRLIYKKETYLILDVEEYNFDGNNRILLVMTVAK